VVASSAGVVKDVPVVAALGTGIEADVPVDVARPSDSGVGGDVPVDVARASDSEVEGDVPVGVARPSDSGVDGDVPVDVAKPSGSDTCRVGSVFLSCMVGIGHVLVHVGMVCPGAPSGDDVGRSRDAAIVPSVWLGD